LNRHWNRNKSLALDYTLSVVVIRRVVAVAASRARLGLLLLLVMWLDIDSNNLDGLLGGRRTRPWLLDWRRRWWLRLGLFDWRRRRARLWWRRWWQRRPVNNRWRRRRRRFPWRRRYNSGYAMAKDGVVLLWMLKIETLLLVGFGDCCDDVSDG
jgi:hypothetical protein